MINKFKLKKMAIVLLFLFLLELAMIFLIHAARLYLNETSSLPYGIYRLEKEIKNCDEISRGDILIISTKELNQIKKKFAPHGLLKVAAALPGDVVTSDGKHIFINGLLLGYSNIFNKDKDGDILPRQQYPYKVPSGCVYLSSENIYGYDSRYFGPVEIRHVIGKAKPVLVRQKKNDK